MRYRICFQHVKLVSMLLVAAAFGGLMAPLPGEAVTTPTVTAQLDPCGGGKSVSISAITKANPGVVTTNGAHGFATGDKIFIDCTVGMTNVNGKVFTITNISTNSFSIGADTSSYVAYVTGGSASKAISSVSISSITKANPGVVTTSAANTFVTGDKIYLDSVGGMTQVNGQAFSITVPTGSTTTFSLGVDTTNYTAYTSGGTALKYVSPPVTLPVTACTSAEITTYNASAYTYCFTLPNNQIFSTPGTSPRYFIISEVNYPACRPNCLKPVIRILDTSTGQDKFEFSNYQFRAVKSDGTELVSPYWGTSLDNKPNYGTPGSSPPYYGEPHTMRLAFNHTFDTAGNKKSTCTNYSDPKSCTSLYQMSLRISGEFDGLVTTRGTNFTSSGNYVRLSGTGNFGPQGTSSPSKWIDMVIPSTTTCTPPNSRNSPLDVLYCPLQIELAATSSDPGSYGNLPLLEQIDTSTDPDTVPGYICDMAPPPGSTDTTTSCRPQVTITLTSTMRGPDTFKLANSMEAAGGGCDVTNNKGGTLTPQGPPCFSNSKNNQANTTATYLKGKDTDDNNYYTSTGATYIPACQGAACTNCSDPNTCTGTILIVAQVTPAADADFPFLATGSGVDNFDIDTGGVPPNPQELYPCQPLEPLGTGCHAFPGLVALYSDPWVFTADLTSKWNTDSGGTAPKWPIPDSSHEYDVDSIDCTSLLNNYSVTPPYIVSSWTVDSGSLKTKATVNQLGKGDVVTCTFHIHKNSVSSGQ